MIFGTVYPCLYSKVNMLCILNKRVIFGGIYKIMKSELTMYLRLSPYQKSHIAKYEPNALLSTSDAKSSIAIGTYTNQLSSKGASSMQPE